MALTPELLLQLQQIINDAVQHLPKHADGFVEHETLVTHLMEIGEEHIRTEDHSDNMLEQLENVLKDMVANGTLFGEV